MEYKKVSIERDSIKDISLNDLRKDSPNAKPNRELIGNRVIGDDPTVYFIMNDGCKYALSHAYSVLWGDNWDDIYHVGVEDITTGDKFNGMLTDIMLIQSKDTQKRYLLANHEAYYLSEDVFKHCEFDSNQIKEIPIEIFNSLTHGAPFDCR
jgi:hypothetical protein